MAQGEEIPVAANVLGTIGTVFWCIQLVPQIWHNWKNKKTDGLPASMMFMWALCAVPFGIYMILQQVNIPIQIQPQIFGTLSIICWVQILYYNHNYSLRKTILVGIVTAALMGGFEALFIFTLRIPYRKGITWPSILFGAIASLLLALGLVAPYFELWKRQGRVIGITAEGTFDIMGGILYIIVLVLEVGIFASHIVWRVRFRGLRKEAKEAGVSVDEVIERRGREKEGSVNGAGAGAVAGGEVDLEAQVANGDEKVVGK
ncbi:hypothetical protein FQN51_003615 [Onygenales sp. PD_10]|nr:hypothetical protein FQN51_003615 [Onygenales sp. PD_10]